MYITLTPSPGIVLGLRSRVYTDKSDYLIKPHGHCSLSVHILNIIIIATCCSIAEWFRHFN